MDPRHRRRPSGDRFLSAFSPPSTGASSDIGAGELSEDDVFFAGADFSSSPSTSSGSPSLVHQHILVNNNNKSFKPAESFGILAALPESGPGRSVFNFKPLISPPPPSTSSSRMIPAPVRSSSLKERQFLFHQSAPINVPMMPVRERRRPNGSAFGYEDNDDEDEDENENENENEGEMLPPHEMVARQMVKSPVLSCSVLEGAGRTLKGRDLRQVRNAVFRQTGFID